MTGTQVRERAYFVLALVGGLGTAYSTCSGSRAASTTTWLASCVRPSPTQRRPRSEVDLLVTFAAASLFILSEGRRLEMRRPWAYVAGSFLTAIAFTFPPFLAMRERSLAARAVQS
ncbi:MAG TPA: DUF2834 domain-containing protein [Acidimicrobiales bacterium]|jgi:hypothetical protein|nr:DUF2834 domain-containing protein [Acidimicrobiales bacterium]